MEVTKPRDFISWLPDDVAFHILSYIDPIGIAQVAQTSKHWRILAEDIGLWRRKCRVEEIQDPIEDPGLTANPWKNAYINQRRMDNKWRRGEFTLKVVGGDVNVGILNLKFHGNKIISGCRNGYIMIWSISSGQCLRTLLGHHNSVSSLQVNDFRFYSGSFDKIIKIWDLETGDCLHTLNGHTGAVLCLHLRENWLVSGSADCTVRIWDIRTQQCLRVLYGHTRRIKCAFYYGRRVVTLAEDCAMKIWDPNTGTCLQSLIVENVSYFNILFDGERISIPWGADIRVLDLETLRCVHELTGHTTCITVMDLKDNILASGSFDNIIKIWDLQKGLCLQTLDGANGHDSPIAFLKLHRGFVISSTAEHVVKLWDRKTGQFIQDLVKDRGLVWNIHTTATKVVCAFVLHGLVTSLAILDFEPN